MEQTPQPKEDHIYIYVKSLISSGQTQEAFDYLNSISLDPSTSRTLAIVEAEFNAFKLEDIKGIISSDEKQIRRGKINDKLLELIQIKPGKEVTKQNPVKLLLSILIPVLLIMVPVMFWWTSRTPAYECPPFTEKVNNKILILPFENVGSSAAKPETVLRDRINQLTTKNELSTIAKLGGPHSDITMTNAPHLATQCNANLVVWGTYSSRQDSLYVILQYCFTHKPDWNNTGELITVKDVTELQTGSMTKDLDDALMSLCGILALREGNKPLAAKWFNKVKDKDVLDYNVLEKL